VDRGAKYYRFQHEDDTYNPSNPSKRIKSWWRRSDLQPISLKAYARLCLSDNRFSHHQDLAHDWLKNKRRHK
jgi:hypothetical protein